MPRTASVAMLAAIPERRMIGTPTMKATIAASSAAAIAEGTIGYWWSVNIAGSCRAKLFLNGVIVSHPTA